MAIYQYLSTQAAVGWYRSLIAVGGFVSTNYVSRGISIQSTKLEHKLATLPISGFSYFCVCQPDEVWDFDSIVTEVAGLLQQEQVKVSVVNMMHIVHVL